MSTTTVILLIAGIAGYVGFVALVLALLTVARRADEAAERHLRVIAARTEPSPCLDGEVGDGEFTAGEVEFLEGRDQRAARPVEAIGRRTPRNAG